MFQHQGFFTGLNPSSPTISTPDSSDTQLHTAPANRRPVVSLACQPCRERHLRCNGQAPCSRCTLDTRECAYVRARRGRRASKTQLRRSDPAEQPLINGQKSSDIPTSVSSSLIEASGTNPATAFALSSETCLVLSAHEAELNHAEICAQQWRDSLAFIYSAPPPTTGSLPTHFNLPSLLSDPISTSVYIDTYFRFFHHTHPILLPRREFEERLSKGLVPHHLEYAVKFNSSVFISPIATSSCGDTLDDLFNEHTPGDGYTVQAMLLLAIGMHANNDLKASMKFLRTASNLALELGMHRKKFATDHGEGVPVLEESWRRTWWELYALDGMLAGVCPVHEFDLYNIETDVSLPCEESEYCIGKIPCSPSLSDFDNAVFSFDDLEFSSFAYRIDAIRTLGKVLEVQKTNLLDKVQVGRADTMLVNWVLHLPASKREFTSRDGHVDEMLLQAHMITKVSAIVLHIPYSDLIIPTGTITACTPNLHANQGEPSNNHTSRTLQAAESISELVRHLTDMRYRSHFLACVVTLAALVHLGSWTGLGLDDEVARQSIRLDIGIMKQFAQVWPLAEVVLTQMKNASSVILKTTEYGAIGQYVDTAGALLLADGS